ncbi:HNH endonuclease [Arcobacter sp.]|uniref:HNH endonuclease n=1 Tax=Arcobacter sp. TaxID=1872629 RepID=UPI003C77717C
MPTKLSIPKINEKVVFNKIIKERQNGANKNFFYSYKNLWWARYEEYVKYNSNPERITCSIIEKKNKNKFINLFNSGVGCVELKIKNPIKNHNLVLCPFCGEAGRPTTLDHFLPKEKYPEYSVLSKNLVPACDYCQRKDLKGEKVFDKNNKRLFLHPYYDIPSNIEIIKIKIIPPFDSATKIKVSINMDLDKDLINIAKRHINTLRIEERFRNFFSTEYIRQKELIIQMYKHHETDKKSILIKIIKSFYDSAKDKSINYWDAILYKGILDNNKLIDYLYMKAKEED